MESDSMNSNLYIFNSKEKGMRKSIRIIGFLVVICITLMGVNRIFKLKYMDGIYSMEAFYKLPEDSVDVLVLGSSHAFENINPAVMWEQKGVAAYDLCGSAQPIWNTYYYLKEALKYQSPKLIIMDAYGVTMAEDYAEDSKIVKNTYGMKWSVDKWNALKVSIPPERWDDFFPEFKQYHTRYNSIQKSDFQTYYGVENYNRYWKGFGNNFDTMNFEQPVINHVSDKVRLTEKVELYYRKVLELAREKEIPMVVVVSPYTGITEEQYGKYLTAKEIADEYNIEFLNLGDEFETIGLDCTVDFADSDHMNYKGNYIYTTYLVENLLPMYGEFIDHRGDMKYDSWEKNDKYYCQTMINLELKELRELDDYLTCLLDNGANYTVLVTLDGDFNCEAINISEVLKQYYPFIDDGGTVWVIQGEECIFSNGSNSEYRYMQKIGSRNLLVKGNVSSDGIDISGCSQYVQIDDTKYKSVVNGVNILVYDNYTDTIVEAVGFNALGEYSVIGK